MKKLLVIALALFTLNGMAQEKERRSDRKDRSESRMQMSPNDIADLKSKKLTLKLDLTDAQQKKVHALILNEAKARQELRKNRDADGEKKEKPSQEEFIKMQNARLDHQIEMKREMKSILNAEQYAKFEKMKPRENEKRGKRSRDEDKKRDYQNDKK
ncbi:Spy/CpxP family protein refolding chaperone [Winogradskyella psychrotolerans]|uniref:Spy/CpxP family protein refolding chaperone n=1 Tax=Winogradskyella psychrotolerans TaxID=1344585 RepID=UPI001C078F96|nr:Spy/CpxP family protein refolding chaperone [Winogradskyella psychrotolerans]MBU2929247.1 hypothetical protein [Winogradskyella psychrotolerans]